jgi:hypothetical protein
VQRREQRVVIETERHRISGAITMPSDGFRSRLSDFLNHAERDFVALTDAVVESLHDGLEPARREFVVVGRSHIVLAMPESLDPGDPASEPSEG